MDEKPRTVTSENGACFCCGSGLNEDGDCPKGCVIFACPKKQYTCWSHCHCGHNHVEEFADDSEVDYLEVHKLSIE